jgi:N-acetylmuramoyl-L-alanine amidase
VNIIQVNYTFRTPPIGRKTTEWIVIHHTATTSATPEGIHKHHRDTNGWSGFGYHAYIRKDGKVYSGRPFGTQGAHCLGYNHNSIGVCFEGNFEVEPIELEPLMDRLIQIYANIDKLDKQYRIVSRDILRK